jgi:cystathionine beta-lyase
MALIGARVAAGLRGVRFAPPDGTYLAWLDFRELGLGAAALRRLVVEDARLWLSDGPSFGSGGAGFQRLNAAAPRSLIEAALSRLDDAL